MNEPALMRKLLAPGQHVAVVGVSWKPHRASYRVAERMIQAGLNVSLVNPSLAPGPLFGQPVYADLQAVVDTVGAIDWVDVFRGVEHLPALLEQSLSVGAKGIWGQLEIIDEAVAERAERAGLAVVMDRCPAIELNQLGR